MYDANCGSCFRKLWYWLLQFSLRRFLAFLRVTTPSFLPSIDFRSFVHLLPANYCWRVILCFKRIMPCDSILHMNLRSLKIIENKWWKTIIDDKVYKLALRLIVLSTLDITSWSEENKSILTGFFEQRMVCIYTQTFFLGKQNIKVRMDFFFMCRVNCGTPITMKFTFDKTFSPWFSCSQFHTIFLSFHFRGKNSFIFIFSGGKMIFILRSKPWANVDWLSLKCNEPNKLITTSDVTDKHLGAFRLTWLV